MSVARVTEIISSSPTSFDDATERGIARASETLKNVQGAWVKDMKVTVDGGKISEYRVGLMVTFVLDD
ncbi:dodecin family protein [Vannielia litorea]|uniref:dodecin family protein n=1 Tax=Vannielia TaxID=2813041 RepID=UPI001C982DE6|nr:dodecin family protein [Vannielia litorea]MBY6048606.1 dodecin family protein [Vannielia litorea]MBY6076020.1 dodecin family protein [Vannielia litorea]MBY6154235.1 dodecin family protein [Vannielia litorea]